jgi:hypothetical protein
MRVKVLVIVGLVLWAWSGVPVFAQEQTVLRGVDKGYIDLVIKTLDEHDRDCGLSQSAIDAAVRVPLSRSGFRIDSSSGDYVNVRFVSVQMPNEICAAYVEFEFLRLGLFSDINYIYGAQV